MSYLINRIGSVCVLISMTLVVFGQSKQEAKTLVESVSKRYSAYKTLTTDFVLQQDGKILQKGTLILENASGKYKIKINGQTLLSDGKTQWSILEEVKEVQITDVAGMDGQISPKNLFSFFRKGYSMALGTDEKSGTKTHKVVVLTPEDKTKSHSKIELRIQKETSQLDQISVFEKSGDTYSYVLQNQLPNKSVAKETFMFKKENYVNYELVDLR